MVGQRMLSIMAGRRVLRSFRQHRYGSEYVTEETLRRLAGIYRRGIAEVLGVPVEAIKEDITMKWARRWVEAFVKPEYIRYSSMHLESIFYEMGRDTGHLLRELKDSRFLYRRR